MAPSHATSATVETSPALPMLVYATVLAVAALAVWLAGDHDHHAPVGGAGGGEQLAAGAYTGPAEDAAPAPAGVRIGSLDIAAAAIPLGLEPDGRLEVPEDPHVAGWWTGGANPGERGPAVIVGHVDSYEGPGAFYGLEDIADGERVSVDRDDGTSVHFRVDRVERHPKEKFPTTAVYGDTEAPTLRLVTCAGTFDPVHRSYEDNVVVFLELEGWSDHR